MRPQQNRRINRRNNGGLRRAPNPLTRNYESSGPDVKIRGNAQHIADKYLTLARDAQASGDRIMGENYLQHAEHYMRIILSAQSGEKDNRSALRIDNEAQGAEEDNFVGQEELADMPQPIIDGLPGEVALMGKRGSYSNTDSGEAEEGEAKYECSRQRRRLPARRSNPAARRADRVHEDNGEQLSADKNDKSGNSASPDLRRADAYDKDMSCEETGKTGRLRKPRRARTAANGEADQPDVYKGCNFANSPETQ